MRFAEHVMNHPRVMKIWRHRPFISRYRLNGIDLKPTLDVMGGGLVSLLRENAAGHHQLVAMQMQRTDEMFHRFESARRLEHDKVPVMVDEIHLEVAVNFW